MPEGVQDRESDPARQEATTSSHASKTEALTGWGADAGSVAVVTGASAGIGRAAARAFGARGASVALIARGLEGLDAAAAEVCQAGGRPLVIAADVANADAVMAAAITAERELGPIDVWVNNAMLSVFSPVAELHAAEVRRVTEVTYLGTVHGTLAALRSMRPRDRGTIVQVSSALAFRSIPLQAAYCAAKHAVQGFTESLRSELLHDGSNVRTTMVHLPAVNTPHFDWARSRLPNRVRPLAPVFQPEVAATAIVWAAAHAPRELKVGWPTARAIYLDRLVPGILDRYLAAKGHTRQQDDEPADPDRPDNLFATLPGDHGTHGRFDDEARASSRLLSLRLGIGSAWDSLRHAARRT